MSQKTLLAMVLRPRHYCLLSAIKRGDRHPPWRADPPPWRGCASSTPPGRGCRHPVRQDSWPGRPHLTMPAKRRGGRPPMSNCNQIDWHPLESTTGDQAITHQEEDRQQAGKNDRPARLRATRPLRCRSSRTVPHPRPEAAGGTFPGGECRAAQSQEGHSGTGGLRELDPERRPGPSHSPGKRRPRRTGTWPGEQSYERGQAAHQPTPSMLRVSRACSRVAALTTHGVRNSTATPAAAWTAHAPARVGPPQER
jgi:hypothetical protein